MSERVSAYVSKDGQPQSLEDRVAALSERALRQEAINDILEVAIVAMFDAHPDRAAAVESWRKLSSQWITDVQLHAQENPAMALKAEEAAFQLQALNSIFRE